MGDPATQSTVALGVRWLPKKLVGPATFGNYLTSLANQRLRSSGSVKACQTCSTGAFRIRSTTIDSPLLCIVCALSSSACLSDSSSIRPAYPTNLLYSHLALFLALVFLLFHDLRDTCATLLLRRGVNPKFVQELLGHDDVSLTLNIYSHVLPDMGDHAALAMEAALQ